MRTGREYDREIIVPFIHAQPQNTLDRMFLVRPKWVGEGWSKSKQIIVGLWRKRLGAYPDVIERFLQFSSCYVGFVCDRVCVLPPYSTNNERESSYNRYRCCARGIDHSKRYKWEEQNNNLTMQGMKIIAERDWGWLNWAQIGQD